MGVSLSPSALGVSANKNLVPDGRVSVRAQICSPRTGVMVGILVVASLIAFCGRAKTKVSIPSSQRRPPCCELSLLLWISLDPISRPGETALTLSLFIARSSQPPAPDSADLFGVSLAHSSLEAGLNGGEGSEAELTPLTSNAKRAAARLAGEPAVAGDPDEWNFVRDPAKIFGMDGKCAFRISLLGPAAALRRVRYIRKPVARRSWGRAADINI